MCGKHGPQSIEIHGLSGMIQTRPTGYCFGEDHVIDARVKGMRSADFFNSHIAESSCKLYQRVSTWIRVVRRNYETSLVLEMHVAE